MKLSFFPRRHLVLRSPVSPEEVLRRLSERVEPKRRLRFGRERPFEGVVSSEGFEINRIIFYRNSFLPLVEGSVQRDGAGSLIDAELTLHPFVAVVMAVFFTLTGLFGIASSISFYGEGRFQPLEFPVPLGLFGGGFVLMHGAFALEVGSVRRLLEEVARP